MFLFDECFLLRHNVTPSDTSSICCHTLLWPFDQSWHLEFKLLKQLKRLDWNWGTVVTCSGPFWSKSVCLQTIFALWGHNIVITGPMTFAIAQLWGKLSPAPLMHYWIKRCWIPIPAADANGTKGEWGWWCTLSQSCLAIWLILPVVIRSS